MTPSRKINLKKCKKGDLLVSIHGKLFVYDHYDKTLSYPHVILDYVNKSTCTRLDNGYVFGKNKMESDHDIVEVITIGYSKNQVTEIIKADRIDAAEKCKSAWVKDEIFNEFDITNRPMPEF